MAGARQHGWKAIPAVHPGYGADTLPDLSRSVGRCRAARTTVLHARHRDRCRRTHNFSSRDRLHEALFLRHYYLPQPGHHHRSCTTQPSASGYTGTHLPDDISSITCVLSPASAYTREVRSGLLCICLTARRSDTGNPRISCSMAYSSPISFRASSAVALLVLIYTSWILRRA